MSTDSGVAPADAMKDFLRVFRADGVSELPHIGGK